MQLKLSVLLTCSGSGHRTVQKKEAFLCRGLSANMVDVQNIWEITIPVMTMFIHKFREHVDEGTMESLNESVCG